MPGSVRTLIESLEDRRLLAATGFTKHYVPNAITQLRVDSKGRTVATAKPGVLKGVSVTKTTSDRVRRVNPSAIQSGFQIEVRFPDNSLTPSQQAIFAAAADRWESIILGDIPNVTGDFFEPGVDETVDDLVIEATAPFIDGVGQTLGQAGPDYYRTSSFLPITGIMEFDSADVADLETEGQLANVIIHEMGHVLGLGVFWTDKGYLSGAGGSNPLYTGPQGLAQYNAIFGTSSSGVPVENTGGAGTRDSHWRESTFGNELMTGFLNSGNNPISRVTIGQWADMGYPSVNFNAFDVYTPPAPAVGNAYPTIGTLSGSPSPVPKGNTLTLTANSVADSNGTIAAVRFYRESNGIPGLQVLGTNVGDVVGDTLVATDTSATGGYTASVNTTSLPLGNQTFYSQATDNQGLVSVSRSTNVLVGPVRVNSVQIDNGSGQRSRVRSITINVDGVVLPSSIQSGAITLTRVGSGATFTVSTSAFNTGSVTFITLTFGGADVIGGSLPDGNYTLTIDGTKINVGTGGIDAEGVAGVQGTTRVVTFHRLFGDKDGDRGVSINDFNAFASAFGTVSSNPLFDYAFDYEGDNGISINDFNEFSTRFGVTI